MKRAPAHLQAHLSAEGLNLNCQLGCDRELIVEETNGLLEGVKFQTLSLLDPHQILLPANRSPVARSSVCLCHYHRFALILVQLPPSYSRSSSSSKRLRDKNNCMQ